MAYSNYGYAPGGNIGSSLPRQVEYIGLKDYPSIQFTDQSQTSDNFFNIVEFPNKLTSGKNIIKLRASAGTLAQNSQIHIEILDFNGDPIYFEPLNYFEPDGTRVISIWIDAETVPGLAQVYLAGRTKANPNTGQLIPLSQDFNSPDYVNIPNIIWNRSLTVQPGSLNKTEIIFDPENPPELKVSETRFPLFKRQAIPVQDRISLPDPDLGLTQAESAFVKARDGMMMTITTQPFTFERLFGNMEAATAAYTYFHEKDGPGEEFFPFPLDPTAFGINAPGSLYGVRFKCDKPFFSTEMERGVLQVHNAHVGGEGLDDGSLRFPFAISGSVHQSGETFPNAILIPKHLIIPFGPGSSVVGNQLVTHNYLHPSAINVSHSHDGVNLIGLGQTYGHDFYVNYFYTGFNGIGQYSGQIGPDPVPQNIRDSVIFDGDPGPTSHFQISGSSYFIITRIIDEQEAHGQFMPIPSYQTSHNPTSPISNIINDPYNGVDLNKITKGGFWFNAALIDSENRIAAGVDKEDRWNIGSEVFDSDARLIQNCAAFNFTASFLNYTFVPDDPIDPDPVEPGEPAQPNISGLTQSFADIFIKNLEPLSGDVHSIRTLYKPGGMFGDFMHAGDTRVEAQEVFYSTSSFEGNAVNGIHYRRPGFFKAGDVSSSSELQQWWTGQDKLNPADERTSHWSFGLPYPLSASLSDTNLLAGVTLRTPDNIAYGDSTLPAPDTTQYQIPNAQPYGQFVYTGFDVTGDDIYWRKNQLYFEANTTYELSFKAYSTDLIKNTFDPNIRVPRLDVYINSFCRIQQHRISATSITVSDIQTDKYRYDLGIAYADTFSPHIDYLYGIYQPVADFNFYHGQHIIAVEGYESQSLDVSAIFQVNEDFRGVPSFIIRRGEWTLSEISIKTVKETGYTPNTTRVRLKVPTEHRNTPLSFKFQYLNYLGEPADLQSTIAPITFNGSNFLLSGEDNLLTGSLFISNTIGSGLELAGVDSGFLRSIGYTGFASASRTDLPGGFLMYSGSVLPTAPDSYNGVGLELVRDSASFFQFKTDGTDAGLRVQTDQFFLGSETVQFISGSDTNIEISSSNFQLSPQGNVTGSNMLLSGTARADAFEFKELTIDNDNSGSFLTTFVDDSKTYYNLNLDAANAMFIRLDDPLLYPIGKITPATTTGYAHQVFIESAFSSGHYFANTGTSSLVEIKIDAGEHLAESFQTRTVNGVSYPDVMKIDIGARAFLIRGPQEWKIQSLNDYKGVTASFGAIHFDDGTSITSTNLDGGAF